MACASGDRECLERRIACRMPVVLLYSIDNKKYACRMPVVLLYSTDNKKLLWTKIQWIVFPFNSLVCLLWNRTEKNLIKPKITKVVYFNGARHYFPAVFWQKLLFGGSILAWHVITRHASIKLLCVFWLLAAVEVLLRTNKISHTHIKNPCLQGS